MSQRRGGPKESVKEEMVPFSDEALEAMEPLETTISSVPKSANAAGSLGVSPSLDMTHEARMDAESQYQQQRIKQWKEGPFATGYTDISWEADYNKLRHGFGDECGKAMNEEKMPCGCCSAIVCMALGAGRVGNMAVLRERQERAEDGETKRRLLIVAGPYWPMLIFVTYPLILGVSTVTLVTVIPKIHPMVAVAWGICTISVILSLALTAFRDPGILPRYESPPPNNNGEWRWSDRAHTYRPRGAWYDPDTAVVVEEFDHTCVSSEDCLCCGIVFSLPVDSDSHNLQKAMDGNGHWASQHAILPILCWFGVCVPFLQYHFANWWILNTNH